MEVRINVYKILPTENKELYRNVVKLPSSVSFPFDSMTKCLSLLYPDSLITFSIHA